VFLTYATAAGRTFLDRELYLPKAWTEDRDRCAAAGIGADVEFATKLLIHLIWIETPDPDHVLRRSEWRRRHQHRARQCHYRTDPWTPPISAPVDTSHKCDCSTKPNLRRRVA
jgi:hypothetical protein